jgi:hypothetical protein
MSLQTRITALANSIANDIKSLITGKQATLVSGTNIRPINNVTVLGSTNLEVNGSRTFVFGGTGTPTVANDVTPRVTTNFKGTFRSIRLTAKTAPTGGNFTVTIEQSATSNFTSSTVVSTITLSTGNVTNTSILSVSVNKDVFLRANITAVNGAGDWSVELLQIEAP